MNYPSVKEILFTIKIILLLSFFLPAQSKHIYSWKHFPSEKNVDSTINYTLNGVKIKASVQTYNKKSGIIYKQPAASDQWQKMEGPWGGCVRGIYNYEGKMYSHSDSEVYELIDGLWKSLNLNYSYSTICRLYVSPSGRIFAGTDNGLYYTDNNGTEWLNYQELYYYYIRDIVVKDDDIYLCTSKGLYKSVMGDKEFQLLTLNDIDVMTIAFDSYGNIWAGTVGGIYISKFSELIWTKLKLEEGTYSKILFDSKGTIYSINGYNVVKSSDYGETWLYLSGGYFNDINIYDDKLYVTGINSLFIMGENEIEWESSEANAFLLSTYRMNEDEFYHGTLGAGVLKYNKTSDTYEGFSTGINSSTISCIISSDDGKLMINTASDSFYVSSDNGLNWKPVYPGWSRCMVKGANDVIFASKGSGLIKTENFGDTWIELTLNVSPYFINALGISSDNKVICAGTSTGEVYVSADGGFNFNKIRNSDYNFVDAAAVINPQTYLFACGSLYLTKDGGKTFFEIKDDRIRSVENIEIHNGRIYLTTFNNLYTSISGEFWTPVFPEKSYAFFLKIDNHGKIYLASEYGSVKSSDDNGKNWTMFPGGIYSHFVHSFDVNSSGFLFAGTQEGGIYRRSSDIIYEKKYSYQVSNNYPNPFNAVTTIEYELPEASFVRLIVYDILGRELETLINEEKPAGYFSVNWNASKYASGVYIYKIESSGHSEIKKMVLLK